MRDLQNVDEATLVDMLNAYTKLYLKLFPHLIRSRKFQKCKKMIDAIVSEIYRRNNVAKDTVG